MAQITINIPDDKEQRFIDAFVEIYSWDKDGPLTKRQFMKSKIKDFMKEILFRSEIYVADRNAKQALQAEIDTIDVN